MSSVEVFEEAKRVPVSPKLAESVLALGLLEKSESQSRTVWSYNGTVVLEYSRAGYLALKPGFARLDPTPWWHGLSRLKQGSKARGDSWVFAPRVEQGFSGNPVDYMFDGHLLRGEH